jgi:type II secretory pathway pseudopilin PulG
MRPARGFTYLGVLLAIALLSVGLTAASEVWMTTARRQRMEQLEWVGQQFVLAIGSYYQSSPRGVKAYPRSLEDLLEDKRYPFVRRHLRRVYLSPLTGAADWETVRAPDGGIRGVRVRISDLANAATVFRDFTYVPTY